MGHNVVEPLEWGVPVSYGPRRGHFEELQRACERAGVGFRISSSRELADHWIDMLMKPSLRKELEEKAMGMLEAQRGAVQRTVGTLIDLIDSL